MDPILGWQGSHRPVPHPSLPPSPSVFTEGLVIDSSGEENVQLYAMVHENVFGSFFASQSIVLGFSGPTRYNEAGVLVNDKRIGL